MKIAFVIDKTQTFQIIAGVLYEALYRNHDCTLFCNFSPKELGFFGSPKASPNLINDPNLRWVQHSDKNWLINKVATERSQYDAVVGINLFNKGWKPLYQNQNPGNYSLEYCWNEIYNQVKPFSSSTTLFCNSETSKKIISDLSSYDMLETYGSPWFDFLSLCKALRENYSHTVVTVLAPHNSFYIKSPELNKGFDQILRKVVSWCNQNNAKMVLKTREKYLNNAENKFGTVISDKDASSHLHLYASSDVVINFCSSAINELAFLEVPYLCLGNDLQKQLHTDRIHHPGIQRIHKSYYSGDIFDGIHCDVLDSREMLSDKIVQKIESLIQSQKDWRSFQEAHFPGNHQGAAIRILDRIEQDNVKLNQAPGDV